MSRSAARGPNDTWGWPAEQSVRMFNVAGNRESTEPGIGARTEAFLARVFRASRPYHPGSE
jgi:hypothetical protein